MDWNDGYIAVDWGTTNRRAYRIDGAGACVGELADERGVLALAAGDFDGAVADLRERLGDLPMLLAGMVGSNRGWREAPYVGCPAGAEALAGAVLWIEPGRTGIVPGVCQRGPRADVMRGEEVQAIGAIAVGALRDASLVCHPGTHSKWIAMQSGAIGSFRTAMTGEIFALLQTRSILADQMQGAAADGAAFRSAARAAIAGAEPVAELFGIRARAMLGENGTQDAASIASGLLIGADVRAALAAGPGDTGAPVALVGRADLCALYAAALEEAGRTTLFVEGSRAFLAGTAALVERFR